MARINAHGYDVVLCEYDLGQGFDGLHLFESCQQHQLLKPSCIFMMVTGERRLAQVMGAVELVPDGYLLKPFSGAEFANRIARRSSAKAASAVSMPRCAVVTTWVRLPLATAKFICARWKRPNSSA